MPKMNQAEKHAFDHATKTMIEATSLHGKGEVLKSTTMLKKELKNLVAATKGKKIDNVPGEMYRLQTKMATMLVKWEAELKTHDIKRAEKSKPQTKHHLETKESVRRVVRDLMTALHQHKSDKQVKPFIEVICQMSKTFLKDGDLKKYKQGCMATVDEHKTKHRNMYHQQPTGLCAHIVNALRAMFRLLEKMVNYVFGTSSGMFKKPDSMLGKAAKDFVRELKDLNEFEEPKPTVHHKSGK